MARKKQQSIKSQKGQDTPDMSEAQAREHLENLRWPDGPCCIECGSVNVYKLNGESTRPGLIKCRDCKAQFTVTVGTVLEDSHIPLAKWVKGFHLMASSKKGISALQLMRNLGLGSYKTAWHMAHRIRFAMKIDRSGNKLQGEVQVDETYVGASRVNQHHADPKHPRKRGRGTTRMPVMVLVETNGNAHAEPMSSFRINEVRELVERAVDKSATIVTDEMRSYPKAVAGFAGHETVNHRAGEYQNPKGFTTNTAESFFSLLKRGHYGTFHHFSKKHTHRYCDEFAFRWNGRKVTDSERRDIAIRQIEGKRLFYKQPVGEA
jgi:transposase-like protein